MAEKLKINTTKLAEWWGVAVPRITALVKEGKIQEPVDGKWPWPEVNIAERKRLQEGKNGLPSGLTDERIRLTRINADRKALDLEIARGETIPTAYAQKAWANVMQNIVNKIDVIPSKLAPLAFGLSIPEIKAIADRMIYEAKNEIANPDLSQLARRLGNKRTVQPDAPKAPAKNKRVGRPKPDAIKRSKRGTGKVVHKQG